MSTIKQGLYYSREHEWLDVDGDTACLGITDYAQHSLGDIVFADGEPAGSELTPGDVAGVVESVKAASDIFTPVSGTIVAINAALADAPERINTAPYDCWVVKLTLTRPEELSTLMDAAGYEAFCATL